MIDQMMTLPQELQQSFEEKLNRYEEERTMPLMSNMELRGMERVVQQGSLQTARESVIKVLSLRFGDLPSELIEALNNISDLQLLKQLLEPAVTVNTFEEFQQLFRDARSVN